MRLRVRYAAADLHHPEGRRSSLELDRHFIERNDFSAARRGYDPDEVDRHLREIADCLDEALRLQSRVMDLTEQVYEAAGMSPGTERFGGK